VGILDEAERGVGGLVVHRLHALLGEGAGVLDAPVGVGVDHAARSEALAELDVLGVVLFGKNHLGDRDEHLPTNHGFDEFFGNLYHLNAEEEPENGRCGSHRALRAPRWWGPLRGARSSAPGSPTLLRPVRNTLWSVMKVERPAVQLCSLNSR